jgi:hypothetical protein
MFICSPEKYYKLSIAAESAPLFKEGFEHTISE